MTFIDGVRSIISDIQQYKKQCRKMRKKNYKIKMRKMKISC